MKTTNRTIFALIRAGQEGFGEPRPLVPHRGQTPELSHGPKTRAYVSRALLAPRVHLFGGSNRLKSQCARSNPLKTLCQGNQIGSVAMHSKSTVDLMGQNQRKDPAHYALRPHARASS